jgi:hypothetical protein
MVFSRAARDAVSIRSSKFYCCGSGRVAVTTRKTGGKLEAEPCDVRSRRGGAIATQTITQNHSKPSHTHRQRLEDGHCFEISPSKALQSLSAARAATSAAVRVREVWAGWARRGAFWFCVEPGVQRGTVISRWGRAVLGHGPPCDARMGRAHPGMGIHPKTGRAHPTSHDERHATLRRPASISHDGRPLKPDGLIGIALTQDLGPGPWPIPGPGACLSLM